MTGLRRAATAPACPRRANYPIEGKVVAYQFGSAIALLVKTAAPVAQTIRIEKPQWSFKS